ncbi:MAG: hypothetical protein HRT47_02735 [Candidatus Caenarcaniphilales bacterium]|nr:hypothetical protein [Candidatus Caenarcaniphilales bacterium]
MNLLEKLSVDIPKETKKRLEKPILDLSDTNKVKDPGDLQLAFLILKNIINTMELQQFTNVFELDNDQSYPEGDRVVNAVEDVGKLLDKEIEETTGITRKKQDILYKLSQKPELN